MEFEVSKKKKSFKFGKFEFQRSIPNIFSANSYVLIQKSCFYDQRELCTIGMKQNFFVVKNMTIFSRHIVLLLHNIAATF